MCLGLAYSVAPKEGRKALKHWAFLCPQLRLYSSPSSYKDAGVGADAQPTASRVLQEPGTWLCSGGCGMFLRAECLQVTGPLLPCLDLWCASFADCALIVTAVEACSGASEGKAGDCGSKAQVHTSKSAC